MYKKKMSGTGCWLAHRWLARRRRWAVVLAPVIVAAVLSLAAAGQTYRDRAEQRTPQRVDGLPERVATRPSPNETDRQQGRGVEKNPSAAIDPLAASSGQKLVSEAARHVFELPSLHARLRMKVAAQGRVVTAVGDYVQLGGGEEKLLHLNLKVPVGSKIGTIQEIRGRDYLWLIRDLPPDEPQLARVGLRQARIAIRRADEAERMTPLEGWMLLGGLSRLLASLEMNFQFGLPRPATLGDVPVFLVRGKWKQASLARLTGGKTLADLPPQLPHEVELTLGAPDQVLPLFPYRIEYLRHGAAAEQGRGGAERGAPLTLIEFFEVRQASVVDPGQFDFDPEEREFDDVTMSYLRKLGLAQPK